MCIKNSVISSKLFTVVFTTLAMPSQADSNLEFGLGGLVISFPHYPGSQEQNTLAVPLPYFSYQDDNLVLNRNGLVGTIFHYENWYLDLSLSGGIPVDSDDSEIRYGMPDLDWTFEVGPQLHYYSLGKHGDSSFLRNSVYLRSVTATDLSYLDSVGWRAGIGVELVTDFPLDGSYSLTWTNSVTVNWADSEYLNYFYSVPDLYATETRDSFYSQSGYSSAEFTSSLTFSYEKTRLSCFLRYRNYAGTAAFDSPIMQRNSDFIFSISLVQILGGVSWNN